MKKLIISELLDIAGSLDAQTPAFPGGSPVHPQNKVKKMRKQINRLLFIMLICLTPQIALSTTWDTSANPWRLYNSNVELQFRNTDGSWNIKNVKTGWTYFNAPSRLFYLDNTGVKADNIGQAVTQSWNAANSTLQLKWLTIGAKFEVNVYVQLLDTSSVASMKIAITRTSGTNTITDVEFPNADNIKKYGTNTADDYLAVPVYSGRRVQNPIGKFYNYPLDWPGGAWGPQFFAYYGKDDSLVEQGLYLACHDGESNLKSKCVSSNNNYLRLMWRTDVAANSTAYTPTWWAAVGVFQGTWETAAIIYRNWAVNSPTLWGPMTNIKNRTDFSPVMKDMGSWAMRSEFISGTDSIPDFFFNALALQGYLGVPQGVWHYKWWKGNSYTGDDYAPNDNFDANESWCFTQARTFIPNLFSLYNKFGLAMMPYNQQAYFLKAGNNDNSYGIWSTATLQSYSVGWWDDAGNKSAEICHGVPAWRSQYSDLLSKEQRSIGAHSIYLDCLGTSGQSPCRVPGHSAYHPLDGGNYLNTGTRDEITQTRSKSLNWYSEGSRKMGIIGEEGNEMAVDLVEGSSYLDASWNAPGHPTILAVANGGNEVDVINMFNGVYHGYQLGVVPATGTSKMLTFLYPQALSAVNGILPELGMHDFVHFGSNELSHLPNLTAVNKTDYVTDAWVRWKEPLEYYKALTDMYAIKARKFLEFGTMLRPSDLSVATIDVGCSGLGEYAALGMRTTPAILTSAWKADDGTVGIEFINFTFDAVNATYSFDNTTFGWGLPSSFYLAQLGESTMTSIATYNFPSQTISLSMAPMSVACYQLGNADGFSADKSNWESEVQARKNSLSDREKYFVYHGIFNGVHSTLFPDGYLWRGIKTNFSVAKTVTNKITSTGNTMSATMTTNEYAVIERRKIKVLSKSGLFSKINSFSYIETDTPITNPDFETGDLTGWTRIGTAFGAVPISAAHGAMIGQQGTYWADSYDGGDAAVGSLKSDNFTITGSRISFLKAGWAGTNTGGPQNQTYGNQYYLKRASDDAVLCFATPPAQDDFVTETWNVGKFVGTNAYFEAVDDNSGSSQAWLAFDNVVQKNIAQVQLNITGATGAMIDIIAENDPQGMVIVNGAKYTLTKNGTLVQEVVASNGNATFSNVSTDGTNTFLIFLNTPTAGLPSNTEQDKSLVIYPNPTPTGQFTISRLTDEDAEVVVTDILGQQILKIQAKQKTTNLQLDKNGVYLISVKTKEGTYTRKLIVKH